MADAPIAFENMTPEQLHAAYDAACAASDALLGIFNQPRVHGLVADFIDAECERANGFIEAIAEMAMYRMPEGRDADQHRLCILACYVERIGFFDSGILIAIREAFQRDDDLWEAQRAERAGEAAS